MDDFFSSINTEPALRTILNGDVPVWLSLQQRNYEQKTPLKQMKQGLNWAQTLGDAAKNGFKVIYLPLDKTIWNEPSLSYYITLLHKRIIGQTVFETKMFNGNRFDSHFYAHCTKNMSGSFTIFGVNAGDTRLDITAKLPFRSGTEYMEFILTGGVNGRVNLNGQEIIEPSVLTPMARFKLPGKATQLSMPANSIAFWVFTAAQIPECESIEPISFEMEQQRQKTSSEQLLQELIIETVMRDSSNSNSDSNTEQETNDIRRLKNDSVTRHRRDVSNRIVKRSEYNAINLFTKNGNKNENENGNEMEFDNGIDNNNNDQTKMQMRNKRFISGGKIINRIYNEIDDMKRRQLASPYKNAFGLNVPPPPPLKMKRTKRDIGMLKNLFDKFDLKKPIFNLKSPAFKLSAQSIIPPITAVHDVFNAEKNEKKLFEQIENPKLPAGDVFMEMVTEKVSTTSSLNGKQSNEPVELNRSVYIKDVIVSPEVQAHGDASAASIPADLYNDFGLFTNTNVNPSLPMTYSGIPSSAVAEELTEIELNPTVATVAPIDKITNQHNIPFVVKELPPTWQRNHDNMEKVRNNLQPIHWPNLNTQNTHPKFTSILPNLVHEQHIELPVQQTEHVLFDTRKRRRRRAIDSKMNDEIEDKIKQTASAKVNANANEYEDFTDMNRNAELLEQVLQILNNMERNVNGNGNANANANRKMHKNPIKLKGTYLSGKNHDNGIDAQKKCKVLSMATEQQCLQEETQPKSIFKRHVNSILNKTKNRKKPIGPLKKFFTAIKEKVEKRNPRTKRDTTSIFEDQNSEENLINAIPRESHKTSLQKEQPLFGYNVKVNEKNIDIAESSDEIHKNVEGNRKKMVPKFLRVVKSSVNKVMDVVTAQLASWWHSMSLTLPSTNN